MKTYVATPTERQRDWYVVDAEGMVLGRLATEVARIIRGKHKPIFTPHMDTGDGVIVINASKVRVTGRKAEQKEYFRHTGYMGHERFTPFASMLATFNLSDVFRAPRIFIVCALGGAAANALFLVAGADKAETLRAVAALQADGTCWAGSTVWQGRTAMRISVSNWSTTDEDVDRSLEAMLRAADRA